MARIYGAQRDDPAPDDDRDYGGGPPPVGGAAGGPKPPGAQGTGEEPIGVGADYRAPVNKPDTSGLRPGQARLIEDDFSRVTGRPLYYEGAELLPGGRSKPVIQALQQMMAKAGLLYGNFDFGSWDTSSIRAYRSLLQMANMQGRTAEAVLQEMLATQVVGGRWTVGPDGEIIPADDGVSGGLQPLVAQKSNPDELERVFRQILIQETGQSWDKERVGRLVTAYQNMEVMAQQQAYDMGATGGTVVNVPSPQTFAETQALEQDPSGVRTQNYLEMFNEFSTLANSPAWGAQ